MIRRNSFLTLLKVGGVAIGDAAISAGLLVALVAVRRTVDLPWTEGLLPAEKFPLDLVNLSTVALTLVASLALHGFYTQRVSTRHRPMLTTVVLLQIALVAVVSVLLQRPYPRTILFVLPLLEAPLVKGWRSLLARFPSRVIRVMVIGSAEETRTFERAIAARGERRIVIEERVITETEDQDMAALPWRDAALAARLRDAEEVICLLTGPARLDLLELRGEVGFLLVPRHEDGVLISPSAFAWLGDEPLVEVSARGGFGVGALFKRVFDLMVASLLLIVTLPFLIVIAVALAIDHRGRIILRQERLGRRGRSFRMLKFRTMRSDSDGSLTRDGDARVTVLGRWLRRHRLDELPQLWNVLRGEMSLVGPRPEQPEISEQLARGIHGFHLRLLVPPGLAGLAQVSAEYDTEPQTKLRYDLAYICGWSIWLDLRILFRAVTTALAGRGI